MTDQPATSQPPPAAAAGANPSCYLCHSPEYFFRPGSVRDQPELRVCECRQCGLVYLSSFAHAERDFYEESGMHGATPLEVDKWLAETAMDAAACIGCGACIDDERRFRQLGSQLRGRSLLDFGCGAGGFLLKAREVVASARGVELERRLREHFRRQELAVYENLDQIPTPAGHEGFEVITMFHVLEHLPDPKEVLARLASLLSADGQIIVEVPHAGDALLTLYECEPFSHFTYWSCHLFLFTADTLEALAALCGLKVNYLKQVQRYPLSNHLHWLATGKPGGHKAWQFLDSPDLTAAYEEQLASLGKCDTLLLSLSR